MNECHLSIHDSHLKSSNSRKRLVFSNNNLPCAIHGLLKDNDRISTKKCLLYITKFICEAIRFASLMKHIVEKYVTIGTELENLIDRENEWVKIM